MNCRTDWNARHWFAYYGQPGSSSPVCTREGCNAPNPDYRPEDDPRQTQIPLPTPACHVCRRVQGHEPSCLTQLPTDALGQLREDG